jgi:hypothetical protein
LMTHFGLGADTQVDELTVYWPSGVVNTVTNPAVDAVITIVEDPLTGMPELGGQADLSAWPVPAHDELFLRGDVVRPGTMVRVLDVMGRAVLSGQLQSNRLDVSQLPTAVYTLEALQGGIRSTTRFTKQ